MTIQLGNWEPDAADFGTNQVSDIDGCLPIVGGWGPFPSLQALSSALGGQCRGAITVRRSASFYDLYAGTATKLYHYNSATTAFDDVSGPSTYAVPSGDYWQFAQFGTKLLAVNAATNTQVIDLVSPTAFADVAAAPQGRFIGVVNDFVFIGCPTGLENSVRWSALNDYTSWTIGVSSSDQQVFADGGSVRGMALSENGLIFQETKVRSMSFVGAPYIFQFQEISDNRTLRGSYSVVKSGQRTYVWFENGLEYYENGSEVPLGFGRVNNWLQANVSVAGAPKMIGCADPINSRVYWAFQSVNQAADQFDIVLIYDYLLDRFSKTSGAFSFVMPAVSAGVTLEGLDAYGTLDTLPYSLDSSVWGGGVPGLAGFSPTGVFGFFASTSVAARIDTAEAQINAPNRTMVRSVTPMGDAATATIAVARRERRIDSWTWGSPTAIGVDGTTPQRSSGRFHKAEIAISAADTWTQMLAIDLDAEDDGER